MNPTVSIAFPCRNRGRLLDRTIMSILRQKYSPRVELVVVDDGADGITEGVANQYGAKFILKPRVESYPEFQSITEMWNLCLANCTGEIVMLQCAEVHHDKLTVIQDLVERVMSGTKIMATPLIRDLGQKGEFENWANHPTEGSRPGWISGAGPHAFRRTEMLEIGGYEEMFYGYGHEDDYWMYLLRKNGWSIEYVESAICSHQWHLRPTFEPITGYANRALLRTLWMEIEDGEREPRANSKALEIDNSVTAQQINDYAELVASTSRSSEYKEWAEKWVNGFANVDDIFVTQRNMAVEQLGPEEMVLEAAWAILRAGEAHVQAMVSTDGRWKERASRAADIHMTWAAHALKRAGKLIVTAQ
jgi:glycosyltransferase involved in cell wall biosynthesis